MNGNKNLGCCYFPTNVVLVDDNSKFQNGLKLILNKKQAFYQFYNSPYEALNYLKNIYRPNSLVKNWLSYPEEISWNNPSMEISISAIHQEAYNANRFNEVTVLVIDFAMPGMNGEEVCLRLLDSNFKIILLTGEADEKVATDLFNKKIIHKFIRKDSPQFNKLLKDTIYELQQEYFYELSKPVMSNLINRFKPYYSLCDDQFIQFFNQFCQSHAIVEYYLLDECGSFFLLDMDGNYKWLVVRSEADMITEEYSISMEDTEAPGLLDQIKRREKILFTPADHELAIPASKWLPYLFPAYKLQTTLNTYYYAYIENPAVFRIKPGPIFSYVDYLAKK